MTPSVLFRAICDGDVAVLKILRTLRVGFVSNVQDVGHPVVDQFTCLESGLVRTYKDAVLDLD